MQGNKWAVSFPFALENELKWFVKGSDVEINFRLRGRLQSDCRILLQYSAQIWLHRYSSVSQTILEVPANNLSDTCWTVATNLARCLFEDGIMKIIDNELRRFLLFYKLLHWAMFLYSISIIRNDRLINYYLNECVIKWNKKFYSLSPQLFTITRRALLCSHKERRIISTGEVMKFLPLQEV